MKTISWKIKEKEIHLKQDDSIGWVLNWLLKSHKISLFLRQSDPDTNYGWQDKQGASAEQLSQNQPS